MFSMAVGGTRLWCSEDWKIWSRTPLSCSAQYRRVTDSTQSRGFVDWCGFNTFHHGLRGERGTWRETLLKLHRVRGEVGPLKASVEYVQLIGHRGVTDPSKLTSLISDSTLTAAMILISCQAAL